MCSLILSNTPEPIIQNRIEENQPTPCHRHGVQRGPGGTSRATRVNATGIEFARFPFTIITIPVQLTANGNGELHQAARAGEPSHPRSLGKEEDGYAFDAGPSASISSSASVRPATSPIITIRLCVHRSWRPDGSIASACLPNEDAVALKYADSVVDLVPVLGRRISPPLPLDVASLACGLVFGFRLSSFSLSIAFRFGCYRAFIGDRRDIERSSSPLPFSPLPSSLYSSQEWKPRYCFPYFSHNGRNATSLYSFPQPRCRHQSRFPRLQRRAWSLFRPRPQPRADSHAFFNSTLFPDELQSIRRDFAAGHRSWDRTRAQLFGR